MTPCPRGLRKALGRAARSGGRTLFAAVPILLFAGVVFADEVVLKNGDRLSGTVTRSNDEVVVLEHEALGSVTLRRVFVERVEREEEEPLRRETAEPAPAFPPVEVEWKRQMALGAMITQGNTEEAGLTGRVSVNRKREKRDEWTFKAEGNVSEVNGSMNAKRYAGLLRYAYSFGPDAAWYHFYKGEAEHDRFADITYRVVPSTGVGYWYSDDPPFKAMIEAGLGWERTEFRLAGRESGPVLAPRGFLEYTFPKGAVLSQEVTAWPDLEDPAGEYRFRSETIFSNPITRTLSLQFRLVDEYDSDPASGAEKNNLRATSELNWQF